MLYLNDQIDQCARRTTHNRREGEFFLSKGQRIHDPGTIKAEKTTKPV
jgi:hypothetical protein